MSVLLICPRCFVRLMMEARCTLFCNVQGEIPLRIDDIRDVAERQLCCGCGICAFINSDSISMVDDLHQGRRPLETGDANADIEKMALRVCPGVSLGHDYELNDPALISTLVSDWGPVREVWEGFASDSELRYAGSSGGVASALALYAIEAGSKLERCMVCYTQPLVQMYLISITQC